MTNEELVKLYQQGDNNALEELLQQNKKFIHKMSRKFFLGRDNAIDQEDLIQEGCIGLIKAAERYNADNGVQFISYAAYWVYQAMHRFMYPKRYMRENKYLLIGSLNDKVNGMDDDIEQIESLSDDDIYPGIADSIANKEDCFQALNVIWSKMGERTVEIVRLRYGLKDGKVYTLAEIGAMQGVAIETIRQLEQRAFRVVRTSKWGHLHSEEIRVTEKSKIYNSGRISLSFFSKLDHELKHMSLEIERERECAVSL